MSVEKAKPGSRADTPRETKSTEDAVALRTPAVCSLTVDGNKIKYDISRAELHQFIDHHHTLKVSLREAGQAQAAQDFSSGIAYTSFLGKSASLGIAPQGGVIDKSKELGFVGIVTRVDLENSIDGINTGTVTSSSPTISLDGARRNAFYRDQSASDVIGAILRKYPLTVGTVDSTQGTLKFSVQHRETDYEYVMRLAGENGLFAFYDGKEFRAVKPSSKDVEELVWRESLGAFSLGLGTAQLEYTTEIYNYEQKKIYSQDSKSLPSQAALSQLSRISPDASKSIYPDSGFSASAEKVADAQSVDRILQGQRGHALGRMIVCHGQSIVPTVAPGHCVKIKGMNKFDGVYWVTSVQHVFDESGQYYNTFTCTPLDIAYPQKRFERHPIANLQTGVVTDNNDPDKLGRVKVKFPWNSSDETPWVRVLSPHAGKDHGWYSIPEIGDEVLVGYEQDSPDMPIALGALYNKDDSPHADTGGQDNNVKLFVTRTGHKIEVKDTSGSEQISITTKDGKNQVILDASAPSITVESKGDISIKGQAITIKGQSISLESDQNTQIKAGGNLQAEASANLTTKASAMLNIEGTTVTVKGTPIQLN